MNNERDSSDAKEKTVKKTVFAAFCMAASLAWAQDDDVASAVAVDEVDERISVIEVIDVTAEKPPTLSADEQDPDIDAILDEAEALEDEEG
jgi:hypothetical protein